MLTVSTVYLLELAYLTNLAVASSKLAADVKMSIYPNSSLGLVSDARYALGWDFGLCDFVVLAVEDDLCDFGISGCVWFAERYDAHVGGEVICAETELGDWFITEWAVHHLHG